MVPRCTCVGSHHCFDMPTGAVLQAAGLNLMPPGLRSIKDGVDKRKGEEAPAAEQGSKIPKFEAPKFERPSFSVPKLGPVSCPPFPSHLHPHLHPLRTAVPTLPCLPPPFLHSCRSLSLSRLPSRLPAVWLLHAGEIESERWGQMELARRREGGCGAVVAACAAGSTHIH